MKRLGFIFIITAFIYSALNVQGLIAQFISVSFSQQSAYLIVGMVIGGSLILIPFRGPFAGTIKIWYLFFISYFVFGTIADSINEASPSYLKAIIPVLNFIGISLLLSIRPYQAIFPKIAATVLFVAALLGIVFQKLNFSMDYEGVYEYTIERAGGVYGDPNQSALVYLIAFLFIFYDLKPRGSMLKILKSIMLLITLYSLLLTFSKTGLVVLLIILGITFRKLFSVKRFVITIALISVLVIALANTVLRGDMLSAVQKERIESIVNIVTLNTDKVQLSDRDVLLKRMMNYIYDNPIIGNGISFSNDIRGHNTIMGVWADAGIVTFLIFILLIVTYFKQSLSAESAKYFSISLIFTLTIFMLSLQTIINQPYLIAMFVYLGYLIEKKFTLQNNLI